MLLEVLGLRVSTLGFRPQEFTAKTTLMASWHAVFTASSMVAQQTAFRGQHRSLVSDQAEDLRFDPWSRQVRV